MNLAGATMKRNGITDPRPRVRWCSAQKAVEFRKNDAVATVQRNADTVAFEIQSSRGQNTCTMEGTAEFIATDRAAFTSTKMADKCVAQLNFKGG